MVFFVHHSGPCTINHQPLMNTDVELLLHGHELTGKKI